MSRIQLLAFLLLGGIGSGAMAEGDLARGHALLKEKCSRCHSIEAEGVSPLAAAPPFRTLSERYPIADLEEALVEGILTGHRQCRSVPLGQRTLQRSPPTFSRCREAEGRRPEPAQARRASALSMASNRALPRSGFSMIGTATAAARPRSPWVG